jgi:glycosyltransferase involved in cell wall biosynthesis
MADNAVKISGLVITFNEERNIERCLNSLSQVCDEIVIIDSFSTDKTKELCLSNEKVRFFEQAFAGYADQKNTAIDHASYNFVLSLDADEEFSEELRDTILQVKANPKFAAYKFNRFTNFCGQWIKHSGWYPDTKMRLWDKRKGRWGSLNIHETVELAENTAIKHLEGDLLHYSFYTLNEFVERSNKYAKMSAYAMHERGKKASFLKLMVNPFYRFIRDLFIKRGFLDGFNGFVISLVGSYSTFLKYAYLRSLNANKPIE